MAKPFYGPARRLLVFAVIPLFNLVTPLLALPAITSSYGASGWGAVAVSQSLGLGLAVVVELGWGLNGPQRVARQSSVARRQTLALSLIMRLLIAVPVAAVVVPLTLMLSGTQPLASVLISVASVLSALSSAWFFIGVRRPHQILLTDSIPRLFAVLLGAYLLYQGSSLEVYGLILLISSLLVPVFTSVISGLNARDYARVLKARPILFAFRSQSHALGGRAISAMYIALPVALVTLVNPAATPLFAAAERLQRMALSALQVVPNFMQGWVGEPAHRLQRYQRARKAILLNVVLGFLAALTFTVVAPPLSAVVFSGVANLSWSLSALCGVVIFLVCTSRATGALALVARRDIRSIMVSASVGAAVGVPAILGLSWKFGPHGALLGEVGAELAVLAVQLLALSRHRRATKGDL